MSPLDKLMAVMSILQHHILAKPQRFNGRTKFSGAVRCGAVRCGRLT
jgi:hypothetical protein